ncbi:MAG: hypothetical protein AAGF82_03490 [Pseudomonadota bacterium]
MANPGKGLFIRRAFAARSVPMLAAAALVASCNFVSMPQDAVVATDGSAYLTSATQRSALAGQSTALAIVAASATPSADKVESAVSADHGDAPWICTASGFGQKSKCRARTGKG